MFEPKCPDCNFPLEPIEDLEERLYRCTSCRCEFDHQDLVQFENDFGFNPESTDEF